jgi:hypothetical protein
MGLPKCNFLVYRRGPGIRAQLVGGLLQKKILPAQVILVIMCSKHPSMHHPFETHSDSIVNEL